MKHTPEQFPPEPDGVRWLKMFNRDDLIGKEVTLPSGRTIMAEDFPSLSKDGANTMYVLEQLGPDHPLYAKHYPIAQEYLEKYFGPPPADQV